MLKLYQIIPTLGVGGAEKLVVDLCNHIDKSKFEVSVITFYAINNSIFADTLRKNNINIISFDKKLGIDLSIVFKINRLFKNNKPDIINTHLYCVPYVLVPAIIHRIKVRVHTVHNIATQELNSKFKCAIMKLAYKYFSFIPVAIGDFVKQTIIKEYKLDKDIIPCIYNGIDTKKFQCDNINRNNKDIVFINVASLQESKNQKLLIDAFYIVKKHINNVKLNIIGDGVLKNELEKQIKGLKLDKDVILKGIIKDVKNELNNANVFVLSSRYEGVPLSVLEGMSCGLPIITTAAGGVVDLVENNKNGFIVKNNSKEELANAMINLCMDTKKRKKMGEESLKLSKKYDIRRMVKQYEDLYIKVLNKRKVQNDKKK